jgi:hypothetical protein
MKTSQALYTYPEILRPVAVRLLPIAKELRAKVAAARALLETDVVRRRHAKAEAIGRGEKPSPGKDALDWMNEVADGRSFDVVLGQLLLTVVAILTTSGLFAEVLLDIAGHPEDVPILRAEVVEVLQETGWKKTALHKLKQMDSFIKESQRMTPSSIGIVTPKPNATHPLTHHSLPPKARRTKRAPIRRHRPPQRCKHHDPHPPQSPQPQSLQRPRHLRRLALLPHAPRQEQRSQSTADNADG